MFNPEFIIGPLVGGVIGYITNALAIRMLFRPYEAKYIFGWKVPFTPGIIPKEKNRIATSIGAAISENLMSKEVLEKNLLSEDMVGKLRSGIGTFFAGQKRNQETLLEFLMHYLSEEDVDTAIGNIRMELTSQVSSRITTSGLGVPIADAVVEHIASKLSIEGLDIPVPGLSNLLGASMWRRIAEAVKKPLRNYLARNIDTMLTERGPEIVEALISSEIRNIESMRVCDLLRGHDDQIRLLCDTVVSLYRKLISEQLPKILSTINIPHIIESRINEMDMRETERLIFQVMDKELRAIIWLGALLGLVMGSVNALI